MSKPLPGSWLWSRSGNLQAKPPRGSVHKVTWNSPSFSVTDCLLPLNYNSELRNRKTEWPTNPKMFTTWSFLQDVHSPGLESS